MKTPTVKPEEANEIRLADWFYQRGIDVQAKPKAFLQLFHERWRVRWMLL